MVLHTPIPQIILAYDGKIDFAIKTNPFAASKKSKPKQSKPGAEYQRKRTALAMAKLEMRQAMRGKRG